jgi:thiamine-phosphate pyrophosphorylase
VHLTSNQFSDIKKAKELGLFVVISTHSFSEIELAIKLGANAVTFSPIFPTPNKGEPKGVEALKEAVKKFDIKIIALGGIVSQKEIKEVKKANPWGFASIRYFCI